MNQSTELKSDDGDFPAGHRSEAEQVAHRATNDLYSATLALRAVVTLLDRNDLKLARDTAVRMLEKLAGVSNS